jgi:hypothetical protein
MHPEICLHSLILINIGYIIHTHTRLQTSYIENLPTYFLVNLCIYIWKMYRSVQEIHKSTHMYIYIYIYTNIYVYMYICMYVYIRRNEAAAAVGRQSSRV